MPRRKNNSTLDDLYDIFVAAPWWVPLVVAAVVYVVLRFLPALFSVDADTHTGVPNYGHILALGLAPFALFAAGGVLLLGLVAQIGKWRRRALLERQTGLDSLRAMHWREFELLVGEAYRRQGYGIEERGGSGPDGGVDLVLRQAGQMTLVQCKQWRARQVGVSIVRELYGVMAAEKAAGGIVVTVGEFTADAADFAHGKSLQLVNGVHLLTLVQQGKGVRTGAIAEPIAQRTEKMQALSSPPDLPFCPVCQSAMVLRTARKGANAGEQFWGCAAFPQCRGTRPLQT